MRTITLALAMVLLASSAEAGPAARRMMAVMGGTGYETFSINGYSSVSDITTVDTGTESIVTGNGSVTVDTLCNDAKITLEVDAATVVNDCQNTLRNITLSLPVTAGSHIIRVHGSVYYEGGAFTASNFRKPRATGELSATIVTDGGEMVTDNWEVVTDPGV